jgi:hypothetical protein
MYFFVDPTKLANTIIQNDMAKIYQGHYFFPYCILSLEFRSFFMNTTRDCISIEIIKVRLDYFFIVSLNSGTAQMQTVTIRINKSNGWCRLKNGPHYGPTRKVLPLQILFLTVNPYTLTSYTFLYYL